MLFVDLLGWWYLNGWAWAARRLFVVNTERLLRFFSISDLLKTLFSPFRQDAIDTKQAPVGVKLQVFGGNLISRFFGLIIRSTLVVLGLTLILLNGLASLAAVLLWPLLPLGPIISVALLFMEVGSL